MQRIVQAHLVRLLDGLSADQYSPLPGNTWSETVKLAKVHGLIVADTNTSDTRYRLTLSGINYRDRCRSSM